MFQKSLKMKIHVRFFFHDEWDKSEVISTGRADTSNVPLRVICLYMLQLF